MRHPPAPLAGYQVIELEVTAGSAADGAPLGHIAWPQGGVPVSVLRNRLYRDASPGLTVRPGDRISLLVPASGAGRHTEGGLAAVGHAQPGHERAGLTDPRPGP